MKKLSCANNWISWILGLGIIPFFIARFFLMKWEYATCWWVTALFMIIPIAFLVWKVFYLKAYLKDINADGKRKLSVWLLSGSTALLIASAYFTVIGFFGLLNPYAYIIPLMLFMIMKIVGMIYDFLSNAELFIGIKYDTFLGIALLIVYIFLAVNSTSNIMIYFAKILAIVLSILLTALVLKSCLLDKLSFKDHKTIMNFLLVVLVAIGVSVYTIYLWFWKKNGAEQALFSTIMGIYAAVLGGAITLGGVAWGIRNESKNRQEDLEKRERERKEEERKKAKPLFIYHYLYDCQIPKKEYMTIVDIKSKGDIWTVAQFINSDNSNFIIKSVYFDGEWNDAFINNVVIKNQALYLVFMTKGFADDWKNRKVILKVEDSIGQYHYYSLWYIKYKGKKEEFNTLHSFQEITEEEIPNV